MSRPCPVCGGSGEKPVFPYATRWNDKQFNYICCSDCRSTFVDPVPDAADFEKMYSKENYHNEHYSECAVEMYSGSAMLLKAQVGSDNTLLDFGCGNGAFLAASKAAGFQCTGVEIDSETIKFAGGNSGCPVYTLEQLQQRNDRFDIIHLGDVLEHLPDPAKLFEELKMLLNEGGMFFVEGPLENNPSPVYYCARLFGFTKKVARISTRGTHAPTHLLRVSATAQQEFFTKRLGYKEKFFKVYETGWPYLLPTSTGVSVKILIGQFAKALSGLKLGKHVFGNRFYGLYEVNDDEHSR